MGVKKLKRKTAAILCISILLTINSVTLASPLSKTQIDLLEKENSVNVNIYTCNSKLITKVDTVLTQRQADKIIKTFFENEMTEEKFYQQAVEKLTILQENNLITSDTVKTLENNFHTRIQLYEKINKIIPTGILFDTANIFDICIFGIKGEKTSILEINFPELDFIDGTIAGRFALVGGYNGIGAVFTLGLLGFQRIYELDETTYPEFPYMPNIKGTNIGFVGVFITMTSTDPETQGTYYFGTGTTLLTIWNKI